MITYVGENWQHFQTFMVDLWHEFLLLVWYLQSNEDISCKAWIISSLHKVLIENHRAIFLEKKLLKLLGDMDNLPDTGWSILLNIQAILLIW